MNFNAPNNHGQIIGSIQGNNTSNFYYGMLYSHLGSVYARPNNCSSIGTVITKEEECHQLFRLAKNEKDNPYEWYKDRIKERVKGTCKWFLNQADFEDWTRRDSGLLIVTADPGCGKSVLAKYLIEHELPTRLSATICYFFFKDSDQNTLKQAIARCYTSFSLRSFP